MLSGGYAWRASRAQRSHTISRMLSKRRRRSRYTAVIKACSQLSAGPSPSLRWRQPPRILRRSIAITLPILSLPWERPPCTEKMLARETTKETRISKPRKKCEGRRVGICARESGTARMFHSATRGALPLMFMRLQLGTARIFG